MLKKAIPVLHAANAKVSEDFYCNKLGFTLRFAYRFDDAQPEPCYMGFERDEVEIHVSSFADDAVPSGVIVFHVENVDELYRRFVAEGVEITSPPTQQSWGNREMYINDPDGNDMLFVCSHFLLPTTLMPGRLPFPTVP